jgi:hypothetical protein
LTTEFRDDSARINAIQNFLEDHGWQAQAGDEWVDHVYDNGVGELAVQYVPNESRLYFEFAVGYHQARLAIDFGDAPDAVLDLLARYQDTLSPETWPAFAAELLAVAPRVESILGDEPGDSTVVVDAEAAAAALHELVEEDDEG